MSKIEFLCNLTSNGRNGKIFLAKYNNEKVVCKISKSLDFNCIHEYSIMKSLETIKSKNFTKALALENIKLDADFRRLVNPLSSNNDLPMINVDILIMEYIDGIPLDKFVNNINSNVLSSLTTQILYSICEAQEKLEFTHYDLHPGNVLVTKTDVQKIDYTFGKKTYSVKTNGYLAVIIDFGSSHVNTLEYVKCPLYFTNSGVYSNIFREFIDIRMFLMGLNCDIESTKLEKFVTSTYSKSLINSENGWDKFDGCNVIDHVFDMIYNRHNVKSVIFTQYGHIVIYYIQTMIRLPMKKHTDVSTLSYYAFEDEFIKIENMIGSHFYNTYILQTIIVEATNIRQEYIASPDKISVITKFRRIILDTIDSVAKYCTCKDVDWEQLLCCLYALSDFVETSIVEYMSKQIYESKVKFKSNVQLVTKFIEQFPL